MDTKDQKKTTRTAASRLKDLRPKSDAKVKGGKTLGGKAKIIDGRKDISSGIAR
jgi:hypothetical protein